MLPHDSLVRCSRKDRIVRERHYHHAENDRDVYQLKWSHTGRCNDERQSEHRKPSKRENGNFFCSPILAPSEIEKLAHIICPGECRLDCGTADARKCPEQCDYEGFLGKWVSARRNTRAEQLRKNVAGQEKDGSQDHQCYRQRGP